MGGAAQLSDSEGGLTWGSHSGRGEVQATLSLELLLPHTHYTRSLLTFSRSITGDGGTNSCRQELRLSAYVPFMASLDPSSELIGVVQVGDRNQSPGGLQSQRESRASRDGGCRSSRTPSC